MVDVLGIINDPIILPALSDIKLVVPLGCEVLLVKRFPASSVLVENLVNAELSSCLVKLLISVFPKYGKCCVFLLSPCALKNTFIDLINGKILISKTLSFIKSRLVVTLPLTRTLLPCGNPIQLFLQSDKLDVLIAFLSINSVPPATILSAKYSVSTHVSV